MIKIKFEVALHLDVNVGKSFVFTVNISTLKWRVVL